MERESTIQLHDWKEENSMITGYSGLFPACPPTLVVSRITVYTGLTNEHAETANAFVLDFAI